MDKRGDKNDPASRPDEENPEWTVEDFAKARPALEVLGEVFGENAAEAVRRRPGRPQKSDRKINQTLRLDAEVLKAYRDLGPGWQAAMNRVLREHMPQRAK
jgi:uncharacterized protein (DUF4415 family)